jgi:hypothetical protein
VAELWLLLLLPCLPLPGDGEEKAGRFVSSDLGFAALAVHSRDLVGTFIVSHFQDGQEDLVLAVPTYMYQGGACAERCWTVVLRGSSCERCWNLLIQCMVVHSLGVLSTAPGKDTGSFAITNLNGLVQSISLFL